MRFQRAAIFCAATVVLAGCVGYQDPRPTELQSADLHRAVAELVGSYTVVDSRHDDYGITGIVIWNSPNTDVMNVTVVNAKGESHALDGHDCRGFDGAARGVSVLCSAPAGQIMFFNVTRHEQATTVKDGAVFLPFSPMRVPGGSTLLNIGAHGGRDHYYLLVKKAEQ